MIDETRQDLASAYVLNALSASEARAFEAELARDPELRAFTDELLETAATLAYDAPRHLPAPEIREKILSTIRAEAAVASAAAKASSPLNQTTSSSGGIGWFPWAIAACLAISTAALWFERDSWRGESQQMTQEALRLRDREEKSKARIATLSSELETLRTEAKELRDRDALSQVRIATLSAQVATFAKGSAVILWDPVKQRGVIRLANLPRPEAGKDYQLWVIDPKYPNPVNGGIVPVDAEGSARVTFTADQPVEKADKFAISIEPTGGVPKATGPIVLLGE